MNEPGPKQFNRFRESQQSIMNAKSPTSQPIRLMLLDDHPIFLSGLGKMLAKHDDLAVVGCFTASNALIEALGKTAVDIILLDYTLRRDDVDCFNLIRALKAQFPAIRLLLVSASHKPPIVAQAMSYGADGFVGKEQPFEEMLLAIRSLMRGQVFLQQGMLSKLDANKNSAIAIQSSDRHDAVNLGGLTSTLSAREQEVLKYCLHGMSLTEIAAKFDRSVKTISSQKIAAYRKLGVKNERELLKLYFQYNDV
ncbi:response regulator [Collimonas sp. NPDC087041]|uniref:response regulator n=1 Tax=Collimonas sp. NPDC087041 TaxID=3363960 RepID=UPI0038106A63